jgi:hypothetical protein
LPTAWAPQMATLTGWSRTRACSRYAIRVPDGRIDPDGTCAGTGTCRRPIGTASGAARGAFTSRPFATRRGSDPSRPSGRIQPSGRPSPSRAEFSSISGKDSALGPFIVFEGSIPLDFREGFSPRTADRLRRLNPSRYARADRPPLPSRPHREPYPSRSGALSSPSLPTSPFSRSLPHAPRHPGPSEARKRGLPGGAGPYRRNGV